MIIKLNGPNNDTSIEHPMFSLLVKTLYAASRSSKSAKHIPYDSTQHARCVIISIVSIV